MVAQVILGEKPTKHQKVHFMVGVSASGKTSQARLIQQQDGAEIVSRDTLREIHFPNNGVKRVGFPHQEKFVTFRQHQLITRYLLMGKDIVIDDTNLNPTHIERLATYILSVAAAHKLLIEFKFHFMYNGELDEVRARNRARVDSVPDDVVVKQSFFWNKNKVKLRRLALAIEEGYFEAKAKVPPVYKVPPFEVVPCIPNTRLPKCIISDIDGTVARAVERDIYYENNVITDHPRMEVINLLKSLSADHKIVFVSGRHETCRAETEEWLRKYFPDYDIELYMRSADDRRPDDIVKYELFNRHLRNRYNVCGWFDDRHRVSRLIQELNVPMFFVGTLDYEF